mgnify:CR=1 FL=1
MAEASLNDPEHLTGQRLVDLELRSLKRVHPGSVEAAVSVMLRGPDGLTARNLTLFVPEDGRGSLHDRLVAEAQVMLGASLRMEYFCFQAMLAARPAPNAA